MNMQWIDAAKAFLEPTQDDIARFLLSKEESEHILSIYRRAVFNARSDGADISLIALKKLLTRFSDWGDAALLYGICLALEDKMKWAITSFEHALSVGLSSEKLTQLAQACLDQATQDIKKRRRLAAQSEERTKGGQKWPRKAAPSMQKPILMKASRGPVRKLLASERERRDILETSSSGGYDRSEEIMGLSIPRTPAERLRILVAVLASILVLGVLALSVKFFFLPWLETRHEQRIEARLAYLESELTARSGEPAIADLLADYQVAFDTDQADEGNQDEV